MSTEIVLHPTRASKSALRKLLADLGFHRADRLWDWPTGSLHFAWFDHIDYKSFDGVEATIYPPSQEKQKELGVCSWALHTRTRAHASSADKTHQNHVIRVARRKFGGNFYNDWYGKNRYTKIHDDHRDARCRGIYLTHTWITEGLQQVRFALPEPTAVLERLVGTKLEPLSTLDPTRVLYNALVPFAISGCESFFRQCFVILLQYDSGVQSRLQEDRGKVTMQNAIRLASRERTVEQIVADRYSFQNLGSMHNAYKTWFAIDTWAIFRKRKRVGRRIAFLDEQLQKILTTRHAVVHGFEVDRELRKEGIEAVLDAILLSIEMFVDYLENDYIGSPIRD